MKFVANDSWRAANFYTHLPDPEQVAVVQDRRFEYMPSVPERAPIMTVQVQGHRRLGLNRTMVVIPLCHLSSDSPTRKAMIASTQSAGVKRIQFVPIYDNDGYDDIARNPRPTNPDVFLNLFEMFPTWLFLLATGGSRYAKRWFRDLSERHHAFFRRAGVFGFGVTQDGMPKAGLGHDHNSELFYIDPAN